VASPAHVAIATWPWTGQSTQATGLTVIIPREMECKMRGTGVCKDSARRYPRRDAPSPEDYHPQSDSIVPEFEFYEL